MMQLDEDPAVMGMDGLGEKHPVRPIAVGRQAELMIPEGVVHIVHRSGLNNNKPYTALCTLFIIGYRARAGMPVILPVQHLHGGHDRTVFYSQGTDFPRRE